MNEFLAEYSSVIALFLAFGITFLSIPAIIRLSLVKKLYDAPDERKKHTSRISPLGGIAIFGGMIISFVFSTAHLANPALNSVLVALFVLFITGVKDDLFPLVPYKKMIGQILAVAVVVIQGDIRLVSFYGLFNVHMLSYGVSVLLTFIFFLGIINSYNFIDGINGLSSGIGLVVSGTYALCFNYLHEELFLILSLSIFGSQLAFLRYNLFNARIFMGDSGSMILGFLAALLSIHFLQANELSEVFLLKKIDAVVFAFSIIIIPIMDTTRVMFIRVFILRRSPLKADRNHIHHALLDIGLTHVQSTVILVTLNILFVVGAYYLNDYLRATYLFILLFVSALLVSQIPFVIKQRQKRRGTYTHA